MKLERLKGRGMEYLHRDQASKVIYFRRYTKKTGEVFKSLRTKDTSEAKTKRDQLLAHNDPKRKPQVKLALELFDQWLETKEIAGASTGTLVSIKASRAHLAPYLDVMLISEITPDWWLLEYVKGVREKTHERRKFFNDRKWLTSFLRHLAEAGTIAKVPKLTNPDPKTKAGRAFSDDEVSALIHGAQNESLRLAILMAVTMGMRRLEIVGLRCDRVDLKARVIRLKAEDTKIRRARAFTISEACWPLIKARCEAEYHFLFPSPQNKYVSMHKDGFKTTWTNLRTITGIKGRFHDLRHTFLTKAFKSPGANAAMICHYAGVSLEVAQNTYLHFNEKDTAQVAALVSYE